MFKCYRQLEHSDCGLTCIRMIARHFGKDVPVKYLREISDLSRLGMSISDIVGCCEALGMEARALKLEPEYFDRMPLPAIIYWQQKHFVVLYRVGRKYHVADPAQGKMAYDRDSFCKYCIPDGDNKTLVILVDSTGEFHTRTYPKENSLKHFFAYISTYIRRYRRSLVYALLLSLLLMAMDFAVPFLLSKTVDTGIAEGNFGLVLALLAGQLAVTVGALVSTGIGNIILTKAGLGVNIEMVNNFLERLARFPLSFFDRKVSSDFVQKINDQSRIKDFLLSFPNTVFFTFFSLAIFSYLLFHFSPLIFIIFVSISIVEIGWNALFLNKRKTLDYALFTNYADNRNHAYELTGGMSDLKVNNAETSRINKWKETQQAINDTSLKSSWLSLGQGAGQSIISRIKELSVTGIGAYMVISGDMTLGVLMSLGYITGRLAKPFDSISSTMTELQDSLLSFQRIEDVLGDDTEYRGSQKYTSPSISFDNVWFKYPGSNSPYVIKNLSLEICPGEVTALVGESGCGKSTLIKLMLGFYIPDKGRLDLSGIPVEDLDNSDWLRHCGAVMQEGKIFSDSILANISLSDNTPDVARAWDMLDKVGLKTFVEHLPKKIYTRLGVAGIELSGGQKQRLMIARALYKNPDILFLDEATSSLDAINEHMIVDQISNIGRGHTIIIAAHRLSTIRNADKIVFLKDGEITEVGTHDELLSRRGDYWDLVRHQLQAEKA